METYGPIFDAVKSSLRNTDVGGAIQDALRNVNLEWHITQSRQNIEIIVGESFQRIEQDLSNQFASFLNRIENKINEKVENNEVPHIKFKVKAVWNEAAKVWIAQYGENNIDLKSGYGETEEAALLSFDKVWNSKIEQLPNPNIMPGQVKLV
jgi:hypothetical protein